MDPCESVERSLAGHAVYGDDRHILGLSRDRLVGALADVASRLSPAEELLDAVASGPRDHRLFTEPTLRAAIGHAHRQLFSNPVGGPRLLPLDDCCAVFYSAARYVRQGGADTPLQDGSLVALGTAPQHGWIWRDDDRDDAYGHAFRQIVAARYGMPPPSPDARSVELLQSGERLLAELVPVLAPSALHHCRVVACVPESRSFGSSSRPDLGGMALVGRNAPGPWVIAESLLHESAHLKLYDLFGADMFMANADRFLVIPWNPSNLVGANRWNTWRALAAFHVYVHLALLSAVAERRGPELEATFGPAGGMTPSHRARTRARFLATQLMTQPQCRTTLGTTGQKLTQWLLSLLDLLDPNPVPDGSTRHLYLDLYARETARLRRTLAEGTTLLKELKGLAMQDVTSARAILSGIGAARQLPALDAVAGTGDVIELRCAVADGLLEAPASDDMVGELVSRSSDALFALVNGQVRAPASPPAPTTPPEVEAASPNEQ